MKLTTFLAMTLSVAALSACSRGGSSSGGGQAAGTVTAADAGSHKASNCPDIDGHFVNMESEDHSKDITTDDIQNGVKIVDTGIEWTIDGQSHEIKDDETQGMTYVGICTQDSIVLDIFKESALMGEIVLSLNEKGQLVQDMKSNDQSAAPSAKDIWKKTGKAQERKASEGSEEGSTEVVIEE